MDTYDAYNKQAAALRGFDTKIAVISILYMRWVYDVFDYDVYCFVLLLFEVFIYPNYSYWSLSCDHGLLSGVI